MKLFQQKMLAVAVVSALAGADALAQATLEEVVVTARKRAETLAESPISVKAFTDSEIRAAGISTPQDFVNLTPNVTLVQTQSAGNSFLNIRGVSSARNSELAAAILIDGVLMSNATQLNQQLFDIQQVEVLRGPQGALYGRNAIGGAVTITTKAPGDEQEGEIQIGYESAPGYSVKGYLGGPLSDDGSVSYRVAGSIIDHDGYLKNAYLRQNADPYKDVSFRARVDWVVSDTLTTDFRVSYSNLETTAFYFVLDADADNTGKPIQTTIPVTTNASLPAPALSLIWIWAVSRSPVLRRMTMSASSAVETTCSSCPRITPRTIGTTTPSSCVCETAQQRVSRVLSFSPARAMTTSTWGRINT